MRIIGITGGVGAGKSTVLHMLEELCDCTILMADDVAKKLMEYNQVLCDDAIRLFGKEAYDENHMLNRGFIAHKIFEDQQLREEWVGLVHPATKKRIREAIREAEANNKAFIFIEAALLIEDHYEEICDEFWYIYAAPDTRAKRLIKDRGYSKEKIASINESQLTDEEFRRHCSFVIDTGISFSFTREQLENKLEQYT